MRTEREAEHEAGEVAPRLRRRGGAPRDLRSGPVPSGLRRPVEDWAGVDLSHVRLDTRTDPRAIAGGAGTMAAYDDASTTVYAGLAASALAGTALAEDILAHELVHAAQAQLDQDPNRPQRGWPAPLRFDMCSGLRDLYVSEGDAFDAMRYGRPLSPEEAKAALDEYEKLDSDGRDEVVEEFHAVGTADSGLRRLLEGLGPEQLHDRAALVSDLQVRVQSQSVDQAAGPSAGELGKIQGAFMKAEAEKLVQSVDPSPAPATPEEIKIAHEVTIRVESPIQQVTANEWEALRPEAQAAWNARAAAVLPKVVAACTANAPELGITEANIRWDPGAVAARGQDVFAFSGDPITVGMSFVRAAEADPEYVVNTVVHEVAGHPDFGKPLMSTEAIIYEAATYSQSLGDPWDTPEERDTYGYIGTEIYAALREVPYHKPRSAEDLAKGVSAGMEPDRNVSKMVALAKAKYAPEVVVPVMQGLYERFRIDPRITPGALHLFETKVEEQLGQVLKK